MTTRIPHNPGKVEWSGENPGIYLKSDPANAEYDTLALFFRVALSPYGRGHAGLVLGAPAEAARCSKSDHDRQSAHDALDRGWLGYEDADIR